MGKRYYCEYCDKTMVASPSIVKTHNKGLVHQKIVQEHYQKYKDPETILKEEANKMPCTRFFQGTCQFGSICRFSHYSQNQLDFYRSYVQSKKSKKGDSVQPSLEVIYNKLKDEKNTIKDDGNKTVICDKNGFTHVFPWSNNLEVNYDNVPPSLRKLTVEDFINININEWG